MKKNGGGVGGGVVSGNDSTVAVKGFMFIG